MTDEASRHDTHDWDAELFLRFESERAAAARDLVARLPGAPRRIFDLGCGPGASTRLLANRFPEADITGLDASEQMLDHARRAGGRARYELGDFTRWTPAAPLDLVFADGALQWAPDHPSLFPRLMSYLSPGGMFAAQMPNDRQEPPRALMRLIAAVGPWSDRLVPIAKTRPLVGTHGDYYRWLRPHCAELEIWETTYIHPVDGVEAVVDWFRGSALRPFLAPLSETERAHFLARFREGLAEAYAPESDGKLLFFYPRLFLIARAAGGR